MAKTKPFPFSLPNRTKKLIESAEALLDFLYEHPPRDSQGHSLLTDLEGFMDDLQKRCDKAKQAIQQKTKKAKKRKR